MTSTTMKISLHRKTMTIIMAHDVQVKLLPSATPHAGSASLTTQKWLACAFFPVLLPTLTKLRLLTMVSKTLPSIVAAGVHQTMVCPWRGRDISSRRPLSMASTMGGKERALSSSSPRGMVLPVGTNAISTVTPIASIPSLLLLSTTEGNTHITQRRAPRI